MTEYGPKRQLPRSEPKILFRQGGQRTAPVSNEPPLPEAELYVMNPSDRLNGYGETDGHIGPAELSQKRAKRNPSRPRSTRSRRFHR